MIYLVFNEGYSAGPKDRGAGDRCATRRSGWRACCCGMFQTEPEIMGLLALMLLQHSRAAARFDATGEHRAAGGPGPRAVGRAS